jgi:hypothetical protein
MGEETQARPRSLSPWKIGCGAALAIILLGFATCGWISCEGSRQMAAIDAETPALIAQTRARDVARPALRGETAKGRAWEAYREAFKALAPLKTDSKRSMREEIYKAADGTVPADPAIVEAATQEFADALRHLAEGASRSDAAFGYEWERGMTMEIPGLLDTQTLAHLAVAKARLLAASAKPREAIDVLSDVFTLARDVGHNAVLISHMISIAIYGSALNVVREMIEKDQIPKPELEELARRLENVDTAWPDMGVTYRNEALMMRTGLLAVSKGEVSGDSVGISLVGGSLVFAKAVRAMDAIMEEAADLSTKPWPEACARYEEITRRTRESWNPIVKLAVPGTLSSERSNRERRAQLRLLRAAIEAKLNRPFDRLPDPFGDRIRSAPGPKYWSAGRNGLDDGGTGDWRRVDGLDIVLDLTKKP